MSHYHRSEVLRDIILRKKIKPHILLLRPFCFSLGHVQLFDPMDYSPQAPLAMEFCRQEYWSGLLVSSPGELPKPGFEPGSPSL